MIGHLKILASVVVLAACAARSPAPASAPELVANPIFRTINIAPFGEVTLSEPFEQRTTIGIPIAERTYLLGRARFADTDSILVTVDTLGRVESIDFVYRAGKDFAAAVAEYETSLGPPRSRNSRMGRSEHVDRVTWSDGITVFEVRRHSRLGGTTVVRSTMRNASVTLARPQN